MNSSTLLDILINGPARFTQAHHFSSALTLAIILTAMLIELGAAIFICRLLWLFITNLPSITSWLLRCVGFGNPITDFTLLQLTFPSTTKKSAYATEQLHTLLRSLVGYSGFWDQLAARKHPYSLEIAGTKDEGIRYLIRIPTYQAEVAHRTILSFLPGVKVQEVADYMPEVTHGSVVELQLGGDYVLPLGDSKLLNEHDMIAFLTGHMRKLDSGELVVYQIVAVPVFTQTHRTVDRRIRRFQQRIALHKTVAPELKGRRARITSLLFWTVLAPVYALFWGVKCIAYIIQAIATSDLPEAWKSKPNTAAQVNPYELEVSEQVKTKLSQPLSEVSLRLLVASPDYVDATSRLSSLMTAFEVFASASQSLLPRRRFSRGMRRLMKRIQTRSLTPRLLSWPTILSSSELSDLYHFPDTGSTKTEDLIKSRSRELPAPLSMKHETSELDVVVGMNQFGGQAQPIGLSRAQRQKHTYVIGKTGTGKTTLLVGAIAQDMASGKGVAVLDPHGDMFRELLSLVPENRLKDVVVFDPSDRDFPVGFNILDPGIEFASEDDAHEWITSAVLSVFAKLADKQQWGPRMEHILRNTTLTALQTPHPTLFTMQRLLTDKSYQREVARTLSDPVLKQFWDKEFKLMGTMQLSNAVSPITHRLGHFLTATMSRHILLQEKSTIRMTDIMNEGKILLVNLSKGDIGEDQSFFFGSLLTSAMWMAAYQRTKIPEAERRDFYVYVDEFQNFATPQFGDIMSEGRKFHIALTVSHQTIAQIDDANLIKVVTGNAGTIISLKVSPQDETFLLPYMQPEVERGDIVNLPPYHFYMKVTGDETEDAFSGQTIRVDEGMAEGVAEAAVEESRRRYASPKAVIAERIDELMQGAAHKKTIPKVMVKKKTAKPSGVKELKGL